MKWKKRVESILEAVCREEKKPSAERINKISDRMRQEAGKLGDVIRSDVSLIRNPSFGTL